MATFLKNIVKCFPHPSHFSHLGHPIQFRSLSNSSIFLRLIQITCLGPRQTKSSQISLSSHSFVQRASFLKNLLHDFNNTPTTTLVGTPYFLTTKQGVRNCRRVWTYLKLLKLIETWKQKQQFLQFLKKRFLMVFYVINKLF